LTETIEQHGVRWLRYNIELDALEFGLAGLFYDRERRIGLYWTEERVFTIPSSNPMFSGIHHALTLAYLRSYQTEVSLTVDDDGGVLSVKLSPYRQEPPTLGPPDPPRRDARNPRILQL
jgi:hypothetical protein